MAQRREKPTFPPLAVAREIPPAGIPSAPMSTPDTVLTDALNSDTTAQAFAQALANTDADSDSVDLQYAQATQDTLACDWLDPEESDAWQAMPPVI